jgi:hypothetical protein
VDDTIPGVSPFQTEAQFRSVPRKRHPESDQVSYPTRSFADDQFDHVPATQPRTSLDGILDVDVERVGRTEDGGNAALGFVGGRIGRVLLGYNVYTPVLGQPQGHRETGDTGAEDEEIGGFHFGGLLNRLKRIDLVA